MFIRFFGYNIIFLEVTEKASKLVLLVDGMFE